MSRSLVSGLGILLGCSSLLAQDTKVEAQLEPKVEVQIEQPAITRPNEEAETLAPWARVEFLNWWIRPGPLNNPLITRGEPGVAVAGALLRPGTIPLTGDEIDFGRQTGVRATVGTWLDRDRSFGVEASAFTLFQSDGDNLTLGTAGTVSYTHLTLPTNREV